MRQAFLYQTGGGSTAGISVSSIKKTFALWFFLGLGSIPAAFGQLAYNQTTISVHKKKGIIRGTVLKDNGEPAAFVVVGIPKSDEQDLTNNNGNYVIKGVKPGLVTLKVAGQGIIPQEKQLTVIAGHTQNINFKVKDTSRILQTVKISFSKNKFSTKKSFYVAKMPLSNLENPQAYTVIPQALIKAQMVSSYRDAFKNLPGTEVPNIANNGRMDISSRGFKVRSQIVDGMSGYTMTTIDPANIKKIEIIRGPSATLYGSSLTSYGGLVNIITKQPYNHFGGSVSYNAGSFGFNRLTADVNTPLNKKKTWLFRIIGAGQKEQSYQDAGFNKSIFTAPSLTFQPNKNIILKAGLEYYNRRATSPFWFSPYKKTDILDIRNTGLDNTLSFSNNDIYYNAQQLTGRLSAKIKINPHWTSNTFFSGTHNHLAGYMLHLKGVSDSTLVHNVSSGPSVYETYEIQQNFLSDYRFGKFRNRLLLGLDFYQYNDNVSTASANIDTVNFLHPGDGYNRFTRSLVAQRMSSASYTQTVSRQNTYSAFLSDVFSINHRWHIMASLRLDRFENKGTYNPETQKTKGAYGQTALSPKIGIVYQPIKNRLSVYANYMNGFQNVNGSDYLGLPFKPQQANQWETGIKLNMLHGKLSGTISAYNILVTNILRTDPEHPTYSVQNGTELSRGAEMSLTANPIRGLNIIAGYAYNYCTYLEADDGLKGRRPDGAGPQNTANLWANYQFQKGKIKGLGLGFGGRYGTNLETIKSFSPVFYVPGYTVLDATIYYARSFYRIGIKVNNLTNETYWNNRLQWQAPRSANIQLTVNF